MDEVFRPILSHQLQHLEKLLEMQVLLIGDDIETFIKIVRFLAVDRGRHIPRGIERGAVRFQNNTGRHAVILKLDHLRAATFDEQSLFFQLVHDGLHFIRIKAFSRVRIETNVEERINFLHVLEGQLLKPTEQGETFLVPVFDFLK